MPLPSIDVPGHASFPSGHATESVVAITFSQAEAGLRWRHGCGGAILDTGLGVDLLEMLVDRPWAGTEDLCVLAPVCVVAATELRLTRQRISQPARPRCH